jgi:hypothetical protein
LAGTLPTGPRTCSSSLLLFVALAVVCLSWLCIVNARSVQDCAYLGSAPCAWCTHVQPTFQALSHAFLSALLICCLHAAFYRCSLVEGVQHAAASLSEEVHRYQCPMLFVACVHNEDPHGHTQNLSPRVHQPCNEGVRVKRQGGRGHTAIFIQQNTKRRLVRSRCDYYHFWTRTTSRTHMHTHTHTHCAKSSQSVKTPTGKRSTGQLSDSSGLQKKWAHTHTHTHTHTHRERERLDQKSRTLLFTHAPARAM